MFWWLERDVFGENEASLAAAARSAGHSVHFWSDDWWASQRFPAPEGARVIFHGSLGNAARLAALKRFIPGAYAQVSAFYCHRWLPVLGEHAAQRRYLWSTVQALCSDPQAVAGHLGEHVFVRPDSPLKPFSGRVVSLQGLKPEHLDLGFYYEDPALPILVAQVEALKTEWRWVIAGQEVVAGSVYYPDGRRAGPAAEQGPAAVFAAQIASLLPPPDPVYVLDICETAQGLKVLELNPWSGADLYACDPEKVVAAVSEAASR